jgi:8-oxo-dGTP pyrophosphatase MutT (NUDIX family)
MQNPWEMLSSREIYKNNWIRLREDQVKTPAGADGIYGVIETKPAIGIVPLNQELETYLVGQYRYTLNIYSWEIPEGGGNENEPILEGAMRELAEETGFTAAKWTSLGICHTSNSFTNETAYLFLAENLISGEPKPDHTEKLQLRKLPFKSAWDMVLKGDITDAMSIIGLMRVREYLILNNRI